MNDDRLERLLRTDPTGDKRPDRGQFEDRLVASAVHVRVAGTARATRLAALPAALAAVLLIALLGATLVGPATQPSTPPTVPPAKPPVASISVDALQAIVDGWATAHPDVSGAVTLVLPSGERVTSGFGDSAARSAPGGVVVRIGESGRLLVAAAAVLLADCSATQQFTCPLPTVPGSFGLDDLVGRWYPGTAASDRTVRQLLTGTSGLAPIGPAVADLAARHNANAPDAADRARLIDAILAARARFAAGSRREPVDSEMLLLETLIGRARGEDPARWIDAAFVQHLGLRSTSIGAGAAPPITPGRLGDGSVLTDLKPSLVQVLGVAEGAASNSDDLAYLAAAGWGSAIVLPIGPLRELTDAADGHRNPPGAAAFCPCTSSGAAGIGMTGHALAWSSLVAYDFRWHVAIGVTAAGDLDDAALADLRDRVLDALGG